MDVKGVITGDIVDSSQIKPEQTVRRNMTA